MTPFRKFFLLFAVPVVLTSAISFISTGVEDFKNNYAMLGIAGIYAICASSQVFIFDVMAKRKSLVEAFLLAASAVFLCVTLWGLMLLKVFRQVNFESWVAFSQGMLSVVFLLGGVLAFWLCRPSVKNFEVVEKPLFLVALIVGTASFMTLLFGVLSAERYFRGDLTLDNFADEVFLIFVYSVVNALSCFLSMYLLFKNSWFSQRIAAGAILSSGLSAIFSILLFHRHFNSPGKFLFVMFLLALLMSSIMLYILSHRKNSRSGSALISSLKLSFSKKESEYLDLKNQINPHFLFNNITMMISFIESQPQKAIEFGHHLADVYRHYMNGDKGDCIPLSEELAFIKGYLEIYKARFDSNFSYQINGNTSSLYILSSVLQELVDNAFKHNNLSETQPMHIKFEIEGQTLSVTNTLNRRESATTGIGLSNIDRRYFLLTRQNITITDTASEFKIAIPLFTAG